MKKFYITVSQKQLNFISTTLKKKKIYSLCLTDENILIFKKILQNKKPHVKGKSADFTQQGVFTCLGRTSAYAKKKKKSFIKSFVGPERPAQNHLNCLK